MRILRSAATNKKAGSKRTRPPRPSYERALPTLMRDHVLRIPLFARQILGEGRLRIRVQPQRPPFDVIRLHQHVRIFDDRFPLQRVADARELLDHVHVVAVEPPWPLDPALVVEPDDVDDHRVAFPLADRVAVPRGVLRLDRIMWTAVDRNHAEDVSLRVEEDQLGWGLDDLARRPHARDARRLAVELGVVFRSVAIVVLHLLPEFRLVHRNLRTHPLRHARVAFEVYPRLTVAEIKLLLRARTAARQLHEIPLLVRLDAATAAEAATPHTGQIGMAIGRARSRSIRGVLRSALLRMEGHEAHRRRHCGGDGKPVELVHGFSGMSFPNHNWALRWSASTMVACGDAVGVSTSVDTRR